MPDIFNNLSNIIISVSAVVAALYLIWEKGIGPMTKVGQKAHEKRKTAKDAEVKSIVIQTTEQFSEKITTLETTVNKIAEQNQQQFQQLTALDKKIDENEIGRIREELLQFSRVCRQGEIIPTEGEFQQKFSLHKKYEALIEKNHITNGVIDAEYKFVVDYYDELSRQHKIPV